MPWLWTSRLHWSIAGCAHDEPSPTSGTKLAAAWAGVAPVSVAASADRDEHGGTASASFRARPVSLE